MKAYGGIAYCQKFRELFYKLWQGLFYVLLKHPFLGSSQGRVGIVAVLIVGFVWFMKSKKAFADVI